MKISGAITILLLASVTAFAAWRVSPLGDARKGGLQVDVPSESIPGGMVDVILPTGKWNDVTVTAWMRLTSGTPQPMEAYMRTSALFYTAGATQKKAADLLNGSGGWGGAALSVVGSHVIPFAFTGETNVHISAGYPRGVYFVNAECSTDMGLSLGGKEFALATGTNSFNAEPGPSDNIAITGSGNIRLGIAKAKFSQFYMRINGVTEHSGGIVKFSRESTMTNELVFLSFRMHLDDTLHYTRDDLIHYDGNDFQGITITNSLPDDGRVRAFDSDGMYRVGHFGLAYDSQVKTDIFDTRIFTRWLTDSELQQIYRNGKEEVLRRGIPKHRGK